MVDGATIVEIKRQQVVLQRGGERVVVHITGGSAVVSPALDEPRTRASEDGIPVPAGDVQQARQFVISKVIAPYDPRVAKLKTPLALKDVASFVDYFQNRVEAERSTLVTTALGPAVELAGVDPELLHNLRLESTDQIIEISGMGIDSLDRFQQILRLFAEHQRGGSFNISVLRDGVVQPLYYALQ